jgi:hypothetical protein
MKTPEILDKKVYILYLERVSTRAASEARQR